MPDRLGKFERREVVGATMKITRAGDGLSEALALDPVTLHHGAEVFVVLRGEVVDVAFPPLKRGTLDALVRKHTVETQEIFIVGQEDVKALLDRERERVQLAKEDAAGVQRLPDPNADPLGALRPTDEELLAAHQAGEHADDRVPACVECQAEIEAEKEEARG